MSENTKIEWADHTWSPWRGCTKISEGCANCYAEALSHRNPSVLGSWGPGAERVNNKGWNKPRTWNKRHEIKSVDYIVRRPRIFPSLCDWLDEEVPVEWLAEFLRLIHDTPHLDWLLLTKRPEKFRPRMESALEPASWPGRSRFIADWLNGNPPSNVWFGVSVENQKRADERIPILLQIPAKLRWLSLEPLIGPVDITSIRRTRAEGFMRPLDGRFNRVDWLVIGGESGPCARPCSIEWIRSLVSQGTAAGVPVFVKQLGENATAIREPERPERGETSMRPYLTHPKGGDPAEWPDDLRVRQFPKT